MRTHILNAIHSCRYLPCGDLLQYCNKYGIPLSEKETYTIIVGLIRALVYLHNDGVVHADVKLENLLFQTKNVDSLHLVDFGLSLNIRDSREVPKGMRGTLNYMAPEIICADRQKPIMPQVCDRTDVWAAGVVLFVLSLGFLPFNGSS